MREQQRSPSTSLTAVGGAILAWDRLVSVTERKAEITDTGLCQLRLDHARYIIIHHF